MKFKKPLFSSEHNINHATFLISSRNGRLYRMSGYSMDLMKIITMEERAKPLYVIRVKPKRSVARFAV